MNTVNLHRVIKANPDKVFRAFTDPLALASRIPLYGFLCIVDEMEARQRGKYHMLFANFSTGKSYSFTVSHAEIGTNDFLKYTDTFDDPNMPGEAVDTEWLKEALGGSDQKSPRKTYLR